MAERDEQFTELALDGAGTRLRRAREAMGLSLADVSARTRIAERHLVQIDNGNFMGMASRAYAVGFARSYARTVGIDEADIVQAVRDEMAGQEPNSDRFQTASFEPGDPARVPGPRLAWIAGLAALAVIVIGYFLWRSFYAPALPLPDLATPTATEAASSAQPVSAVPPATTAPVVFTALEPGVWVKFYDAGGMQLMQKQMALGETYIVPDNANGPMIRTARPDALQVSVGGHVVAKLSDRQETIGDVPVSAAALLARGTANVAAPSAAASGAGAVTAFRPAAQSGPAAQRNPGPSVKPAAVVPRQTAAVAAPAAVAPAMAEPAAPAVPVPQSSTVSQ